MVALVDVPGVQEAVEQILATERAEAEQQAEKLRAELAEIEARLAELRERAESGRDAAVAGSLVARAAGHRRFGGQCCGMLATPMRLRNTQ